MRILVCLAQEPSRLSRSFQLVLNAAMQSAAEAMRGNPLPPLYKSHVQYQSEPWAGQGVEEFADPWTVYERGWGDCDDLIIYRGAELIVNGYPCHAAIIHDTRNDKYHTQIHRDFGNRCFEDPCLQRLGRPVSEWLIPSYSSHLRAARSSS